MLVPLLVLVRGSFVLPVRAPIRETGEKLGIEVAGTARRRADRREG